MRDAFPGRLRRLVRACPIETNRHRAGGLRLAGRLRYAWTAAAPYASATGSGHARRWRLLRRASGRRFRKGRCWRARPVAAAPIRQARPIRRKARQPSAAPIGEVLPVSEAAANIADATSRFAIPGLISCRPGGGAPAFRSSCRRGAARFRVCRKRCRRDIQVRYAGPDRFRADNPLRAVQQEHAARRSSWCSSPAAQHQAGAVAPIGRDLVDPVRRAGAALELVQRAGSATPGWRGDANRPRLVDLVQNAANAAPVWRGGTRVPYTDAFRMYKIESGVIG